MQITRDTLHELGSCGDYLRIFRDVFPTSEYPQGVEVTRAICEAHAGTFDWSWAAEKMLTTAGYNEFYRLAYNTSGNGDDLGRSNSQVRPAAVFGHLFETRPELHSDRLVQAARTAEERNDDKVLSRFTSARAESDDAVSKLAYWTEQAPLRAAQLIEAETAAAPARVRKADRRITQAAEEIARREASLEEARAEAVLAAEARAELPEPESEPTTEMTETTETAIVEPETPSTEPESSANPW